MWTKALRSSADPERAKNFFEQLKTQLPLSQLAQFSPEQIRIIAALFSGSQALSEVLLTHSDWIASRLHPDAIQYRRQKQGLERQLQSTLAPVIAARDFSRACALVREFKQQEILRIAGRDLARFSNVIEITGELSDLADVTLAAIFQICCRELTDRFGSPFHQDADGHWRPTEFCVLGMGKLGGQELNYSSDVDLLFVYSDEGAVFKDDPARSKAAKKGLTNHQFFNRLGESFISEVIKLTPDGSLYRIDMRLRPEGNSGPLARSLPSYENYYAQWGQTWERMMLIKARGVAGSSLLAMEFLEMVQPFRYPRSLGPKILQEVARTKERIEAEIVKAGELERNVKLGRGGIRDVEFIVQSLQLLHGGRIPFLQNPQTLPTLQKCVDYNLLSESDAAALAKGYCFLRDVEHRLQMEGNRQTHTLPADKKPRSRIAALMGSTGLNAFDQALAGHTRAVRAIYERLLSPPEPSAAEGELPPEIAGYEAQWKTILAAHSFRDPAAAIHLIQLFIAGPGYVHVSSRTTQLALQLLARFFSFCPPSVSTSPRPEKTLSDPDRVLNRLDSYVTAYGSRAMLYELWTTNSSLFDLLLFLFDRSEFLAEVAIRSPDLVDELELSGRLRRRKSADEIRADLQHGLQDPDQKLWLRRYHQAELMRIGLREILGLADFEQNLTELSALADACLQYAFEILLRQRKLRKPPFAIIGLGKLGGRELNYGSDLDLMFVAATKTKQLPQSQRLAAELMDMLSSPTELGVAFKTDARLRPDGEKGLLVNTLSGYQEYYRHRAMLWEIQALTRIRPIGGDIETGRAFAQTAASLTNFQQPASAPAAFVPAWKQEIARMRRRIELERTPAGKDALAIKTGRGGLMDAEFIAQAACLEFGWQEPNTLAALQRLQKTNQLPAPSSQLLIDRYRQLRRVEGILRRWSFEGETLLPDDPAPLYRVAVRCGFPTAGAFMESIRTCRDDIRSVFSAYLP